MLSISEIHATEAIRSVFRDEALIADWMDTPHDRLDGKTPHEALKQMEYGKVIDAVWSEEEFHTVAVS